MNASTQVAEKLKHEREHVLADWEARVRASVPSAREQQAAALRDSMPSIVERIADAVATGDLRGIGLAQEHGKERAQRSDYTIEEVIREYQLLETVLFEVIERDGPLAQGPRDSLRSAIQACVLASAAEFDADQRHELTRDRELYQHLVEGVRDYAIFAVDPNGIVSSWNQGAMRMKQFTADEIIGVHFSILYPEDARQRDEPMEHLRMARDRGRYRGEGWRRKKSGELFLADVLITPMCLRGKLEGFSKVVADLTERSRIVQERELSRTRILAVEAEQKAREEYVARLSHDVRSPLQAAKLAAQLLRDRRDDAKMFDRLMTRVGSNLERADEMIKELLDLNRLRAGQMPAITVQPMVLDRLVLSTLETLATIHGDRFVLVTHEPIEGAWDPDAIRRIVENLCGNAVKYGSPMHPITVTLTRTTNEAQIAVHNEGDPIAAEERERLFDQFARATGPASTTRGWGIGLAVVKSLAEAHGGRVRVDSEERAGTTFKIDLPLKPPPSPGPR